MWLIAQAMPITPPVEPSSLYKSAIQLKWSGQYSNIHRRVHAIPIHVLEGFIHSSRAKHGRSEKLEMKRW